MSNLIAVRCADNYILTSKQIFFLRIHKSFEQYDTDPTVMLYKKQNKNKLDIIRDRNLLY